MPDYLKRTGRDITDDMTIRIPESEKKVARLDGPARKRLGIDRGSIPSVAAPLEGQMMIQYADEAVGATPVAPEVGSTFLGEEPYYYSNGEWRTFFTGYDPNPSVALYACDETVASLDAVVAAWTLTFGDAALLDLTDPQFPVPTLQAVYSVTATITSPDSTWSAGENMVGKLDAFGPTVNQHQEDSGTFGLIPDPAQVRAFVSLTAQMDASPGGTFKLTLENEGAASHTLIAGIAVQRILVY